MITKPSTSGPLAERVGLQPLARRFKLWRAARPRGQRIPDHLWQAAIEVARLHGLNPTVAALKLNYYDLQRRLQARRTPRPGSGGGSLFVEVPVVPGSPGHGERGTIELVRASGERLVLRFADASPRDLLPLVQLFLRRRA